MSFKKAWQIFSASKECQRELTRGFVEETGVNFMHLDTPISKPWLIEALTA